MDISSAFIAMKYDDKAFFSCAREHKERKGLLSTYFDYWSKRYSYLLATRVVITSS